MTAALRERRRRVASRTPSRRALVARARRRRTRPGRSGATRIMRRPAIQGIEKTKRDGGHGDRGGQQGQRRGEVRAGETEAGDDAR